MNKLRHSLTLACAATLVSAFVPYQGHTQDGPLRQAIRQRLLKKMQNKPAPASNTDVQSKITKSGDYTFSFSHGGLNRMYIVHVPTQYKAENPAPLLIAFHGGGGDMSYQANDEYYGLISKSNKEGFIAVFPNGSSKLPSGKLATWNAGNCCGGARDNNVDDVGFVKELIEHVTHQLKIDRKRIFATGMSNGGMMAHRLACEMSDTFKAIAAVAGTDNTKTCTPKTPISILHIHAKNDDHVLFNGGAGQTFRDPSTVTNFTSVPETISRWVKRNGCNPTPKRVIEKQGAYCDLYSQCQNGVQVELCVTDSGGHSWPGGVKPRGDEPPSQAISANDVMWDFFQ